MGGRRPPVVDPDKIRDDWATKPRRGRVGARRGSQASTPAEAPTQPPRPWEPVKRDWPTLAQIYDWGPAPYSMESVRKVG